ncbi:hypothetical protein Tco_0205676 [Tanacetum coccineum]
MSIRTRLETSTASELEDLLDRALELGPASMAFMLFLYKQRMNNDFERSSLFSRLGRKISESLWGWGSGMGMKNDSPMGMGTGMGMRLINGDGDGKKPNPSKSPNPVFYKHFPDDDEIIRVLDRGGYDSVDYNKVCKRDVYNDHIWKVLEDLSLVAFNSMEYIVQTLRHQVEGREHEIRMTIETREGF